MKTIIGIDIGNSYTKVTLNKEQMWAFKNQDILNNPAPIAVKNQRLLNSSQEIILSVSSVIKDDATLKIIRALKHLFNIKTHTITKIWSTPEILAHTTLKNQEQLAHFGSDRALRIYHLATQAKGSAKISCGCGSAFTVEVVQNDLMVESYILPGLDMQLTSLYTNTAKLPHITAEKLLTKLANAPKFSPEYSIISGILKAYYSLIDKMILEYKPQQILLSGGYALMLKANYLTQNNVCADRYLESEILIDLAQNETKA